MFERYTEQARGVIFYARYEASQFGSSFIDTEHVLLGLLREATPFALGLLGAEESLQDIRQQIERVSATGKHIPTSQDLPLSDAAKRVLAYAAEEAERLRHRHIGPEHLVLGMLREHDCLAARLLRQRGADLQEIREGILSGTYPLDDRLAVGHRRRVDMSEVTQGFRSPIIFRAFDEAVLAAVNLARQEAAAAGSPFVEPHHLLIGTLRAVPIGFITPLLDEAFLRTALQEIGGMFPRKKRLSEHEVLYADDTDKALNAAFDMARQSGAAQVSAVHVISALKQENTFAAQLLRRRIGS